MTAVLGKIHDVREELARSPSAIASLTALPAHGRIASHVHANPYLSLYVLGSVRDNGDRGDDLIDGPTALFFPAGSAHEMSVGRKGLATVIIEFDRDVLRQSCGGNRDLEWPRLWAGGRIGLHACRLARAWMSDTPRRILFQRTISFLREAFATESNIRGPSWFRDLQVLMDNEIESADIGEWSKQLGLSRPWLNRAYRAWRGEGLGEALSRRQIENAAIMFENSDLGLAEVASRAGFCDQSHMNRAFMKLLGRTPGEVRLRRLGLSQRLARDAAA